MEDVAANHRCGVGASIVVRPAHPLRKADTEAHVQSLCGGVHDALAELQLQAAHGLVDEDVLDLHERHHLEVLVALDHLIGDAVAGRRPEIGVEHLLGVARGEDDLRVQVAAGVAVRPDRGRSGHVEVQHVRGNLLVTQLHLGRAQLQRAADFVALHQLSTHQGSQGVDVRLDLELLGAWTGAVVEEGEPQADVGPVTVRTAVLCVHANAGGEGLGELQQQPSQVVGALHHVGVSREHLHAGGGVLQDAGADRNAMERLLAVPLHRQPNVHIAHGVEVGGLDDVEDVVGGHSAFFSGNTQEGYKKGLWLTLTEIA